MNRRRGAIGLGLILAMAVMMAACVGLMMLGGYWVGKHAKGGQGNESGPGQAQDRAR